MNTVMDTIRVSVRLQESGDALLRGATEQFVLAGLFVKQRLFARHEASCYGTELDIRTEGWEEWIVLPAAQVIAFFASTALLRHIRWEWDADGYWLTRHAALLLDAVEQRRYVPDLEAFRGGKLVWRWDESGRYGNDVRKLRESLADEAAPADEQTLSDEATPADEKTLPDESRQGVRAAFSAAVYARWYGTPETLADLRRDYPALFKPAGAGLDAAELNGDEWLVAIGWKPDPAPFRPLLRLSEPVDAAEADWRLDFVLQDKQDASRVVEVALSADGNAAGRWPAPWTDEVLARAPGWLSRLRTLLPRYPFTEGSDVLAARLDDAAAWRFLTEDSRRLLESGWQVLLPAWWEAARAKKPRIRARFGGNATIQGNPLFGLDSLLAFDWRIAIGDVRLTEKEFAALVAKGERLVRFRDEWLALDPDLLAQIQRAMSRLGSGGGVPLRDVLQLHLLQEEDGAAGADGDGSGEGGRTAEETVRLEVELGGHLHSLVSRLGAHKSWPQADVPGSLRAELRAYQREGFSWLVFLRQFGLGACLADDMGLGKTIQFIAYLLYLQEEAQGRRLPAAPSLLVCPTSVLGNWQQELRRFAPSLSVHLHYGSRRAEREDFLAQARGADVVLTSYALAALDQETLADMEWSAICLDEAQNIKNAHTKQSVAVRGLRARHRIALTGTPIENRLAELWSICDFITPGYLGTRSAFQQRFGTAVEKARDAERTADLRKLVQPFLLRRTKKDPAIRLDLPEKNEMKTYVHLTAEQGVQYDRAVDRLMKKMNHLAGIERKGAILATLTQLKQICDHPALTEKTALPEPDAARPVWRTLVSRSSKLERLVAMVQELREEGERCLIFTQYVGMGEMLRAVLRHELEDDVFYLNGSTPKAARDSMIAAFQSAAGDAPGVFVLSLKAGGVGLNLTAASHVFHYDRWWNPAVENQATDRAYRIGQTKDVQVHKFIALGTLEEKIDEMLETKRQLSETIITGSSESWITELSTEALQELFALRRDLLTG